MSNIATAGISLLLSYGGKRHFITRGYLYYYYYNPFLKINRTNPYVCVYQSLHSINNISNFYHFFFFFYAQHFLLQCCIRLLTTLQKQLTLLNSQKHENFHKIMLYTRYIPFFFVCVNTRYIPYHL